MGDRLPAALRPSTPPAGHPPPAAGPRRVPCCSPTHPAPCRTPIAPPLPPEPCLPLAAPRTSRLTLPAMPTKAQRMGDRLSAALRPARCEGALPTPEEWAAWHGNVITPYRRSGGWLGWMVWMAWTVPPLI
jgi:hypothetical protein